MSTTFYPSTNTIAETEMYLTLSCIKGGEPYILEL